MDFVISDRSASMKDALSNVQTNPFVVEALASTLGKIPTIADVATTPVLRAFSVSKVFAKNPALRPFPNGAAQDASISNKIPNTAVAAKGSVL
jgi:hypothetical protein